MKGQPVLAFLYAHCRENKRNLNEGGKYVMRERRGERRWRESRMNTHSHEKDR